MKNHISARLRSIERVGLMIATIILIILNLSSRNPSGSTLRAGQIRGAQANSRSEAMLSSNEGGARVRTLRWASPSLSNADIAESTEFLKHYGYLKATKNEEDSVGTLEEPDDGDKLSEGVKKFQQRAHITQTGVLDKITRNYMKKPRCAMPDIDESIQQGLSRSKRYALGKSKWSEEARGRLTYRIERYPSNTKLSRQEIDELFKKAFGYWSQAAYVDFRPKKTGDVTFSIKFVRRNHGDKYHFDGPGRTLAHAFYPTMGGAIHFDDEETWSINNPKGTNMLPVAVHEIGHALGLLHSDKENAVMWPWNGPYKRNFSLAEDDVAAVRAHYGVRDVIVVNVPDEASATTSTTTTELITPAPRRQPKGEGTDLCENPKFDAYMGKGNVRYIFKGRHYWKPPSNNDLGKAYLIENGWPDAPDDIDAALAHKDIYLFKGYQYWTYNYKRQLKKEASSMGDWAGIPNDLDAVFTWPKDNTTYFFKEDKYWSFDWDTSTVGKEYPLPLSEWIGTVFDRVDAVISNGNGTTFFIEDDRFVIYDDQNEAVVGKPLMVSEHLNLFAGCRKASG